MERNLKILDKMVGKVNIYKLIQQLSERAHTIMAGGTHLSDIKENNLIQIVLEEFLRQIKEN